MTDPNGRDRSRRSLLRTLGLSGTGIAGAAIPLSLGGSRGDPSPRRGPIPAGRVLAQAEGAPDVREVIARVVDRLDDVVAAGTEVIEASLPSGLTDLVAAAGVDRFLPPASTTLDLRRIDLDYRVVLVFPGLNFGPPGNCPQPDPIPGLFLSGLGVGIDQRVDAPGVNWETQFASQPWFGLDPLGCVYSGTQVSVDLPPPDGPRSILPNLDAVSAGSCSVRCPDDLLDPVVATVEEFVEAAVNFMSELLRRLVELLEDFWGELTPVERVVLLVILALLVLSATTSFSITALVASILTGGTATIPIVGLAAVASLLAAAMLASPDMPGSASAVG